MMMSKRLIEMVRTDPELRKELLGWFRGDFAPSWLIEWSMDHYADCMPYGVMKCRTGTPDEWLGDREDEVAEHFGITEEELKQARGEL
jgi:hypothetical protein